MRKVLGLMLAAMLLLGAGTAMAAAVNPVDQLTGAVWMESSQENKYSMIFGVECAVTVEYFVAERMAEKANKGKKSKAQVMKGMSPFTSGWISAFDGVSREKIVNDVDAWYKAHPDQWARPVFAVLWHEFIAPKLEKR